MSDARALMATPALREGDTIAVVAPAGPVPLKRLRPALSLLEKRFRIIVAEDIARRDGFLAGDDQRRAEEFNAALGNADVRCIWAARGGYGCSRIVPFLDGAALRKDPVPIVGFSDVTVLLSWAASLGLRSVHGPVLTQFAELGEPDQEWLLDMLQGKLGRVLFTEGLSGFDAAGPLEAYLVGGNLSLMAHLCGTAWAPDYSDALCILEDVGERPYAVDRYLQQLLSQESPAGLCSAAGVLLGDFAGCAEPSDASQNAIDIAVARLRSAGLPCGAGLPVGHGTKNRAFPYGAKARLEEGKLWLLESAVED